ncbi:hypothetical protein [Burkholderia sp. WAC0059]|uniref:hypothetical protein n=1 Tax=Burkholderia sp. WAC0059 TaxID=2066022 RepID=UPI0011AEC8A6|nr:hypothetical protein [Burkholderia sp. WAC0059]
MKDTDSGWGTSGNVWHWVLPPSQLVQVCVVVDCDVAARALDAQLGVLPEVAMFRLDDPVRAHRAWSRLYSRDRDTALGCEIAQQMRRLPQGVLLLLWSSCPADMDWLGGVAGHRVEASLRWAGFDGPAQTQRFVERVLAITRTMVLERISAW